MVSGYPVLDGQSRSQFTSSSASTTLSLAAIGLHSEETVSHTFPHCAANAEITNFSFLFFFLFPLSAESLIIGRTTHFRLFQNFFFFKRAREPRNKPRDLNLPISQNTWRSSNISPFSIIEQCANLSELPVQIPASLPTSYVKRLPTSTIKIKIIYIYTLFHQRINK